ncbi:MAG: sulfite exporter TauE/SafE family protein [Salinivirgaceae bacterium]|nr:sulfite exporter TauE/SafE family protein [Salinivirgaceae bacterium]MDD4747257.1 sulfite exporter TauE/SafE family protein [Salinivirgaceae bacterium]MDY0281615.1 sulfite exporter TauE/SafE family protein [Salinivirgaceae bacterium]
MSIEHLAIVAFVGFIAGFINVLAASGSMMTLPLLIFLGVDPNVANGTNRIAIIVQNIIAVRSFRKQKLLSYRTNVPIMVAAVIGAFFGTITVVSIDKEALNLIIGILLLAMFLIMLFNPKLWVKKHENINVDKIKHKSQFLIFFLIGFYGGFIQAGVGVFLIAGLVVGIGYDLLRANAVKLLIMLVYTPVSLAIFLYYGYIDWEIGLFLAAGHAIGAYLASKYAAKIGTKYIHYFLLVVILASGLKLVGAF